MAAFQTGWLYYVARLTALAANANVFATYAGTLWPPLGTPVGRGATIAALVALLTWVNIVGVKRAVRALDLLTLLKAVPLVGLALWGVAHAAQGLPAPGPVPPLSALEASALVLLYAFVGFENASVPAEETADPKRTIPRAILFTVVATAILYFLVQLGYAAVMPAGPAPEAPLGAYAQVLIGPVGRDPARGHRHGLGRRQCRRLDDLDAARHLCAEPAGRPARLVRADRRAPCDAGQFDPVHGPARRLAGGDRQLRLARHRQHARPALRLRAPASPLCPAPGPAG